MFNCRTVCDKDFEQDVIARLEKAGFNREKTKKVVFDYMVDKNTDRFSIFFIPRRDYHDHDSYEIYQYNGAEGCYLVDVYRNSYETIYVLSLRLGKGGKLDVKNEANIRCLNHVLGTSI
jgi:predicted transcriptional regulator